MKPQREALPALPPMLPGLLALAAALLALPASAQTLPITPGQRATAQQVAEAGVPLADLAPNAPDRYTVKSGDTLWGVSSLYLTSPWRWPELWGMNLQEVRNPHRIFPGQQLVLEKRDGRATLRVAQAGGADSPPTETVRVSPRARIESLPDRAIPMLQAHLIEPFLAEPMIVSQGALDAAPRIVAAPDNRVLITRGDRVYARSSAAPLSLKPGPAEEFRVFRQAVPLRDPFTRAVLGYEAQYLGKAVLVRGEGSETAVGGATRPVPATLDVVFARGEMGVGDRLLPDPGRQLVSYAPRAPEQAVQGAAVVSMYGDAVGMAGQNQIVTINKGSADGMSPGHVLAILRSGDTLVDRSQAGERTSVKLPDERNGLMMVFRTFDKLSYALILDTKEGVRVGDRLVSPR